MRGLRIPGHEAQVTQVVGSLARTDPRFAADFARAVLELARQNPAHARAVASLGAVPDALDCHSEHTVYDSDSWTLGRVDLRFDGEDFTLFIENKLHSGFGPDQLERYREALALLPSDRRAGLVAITRDVPSTGELDPGVDGWLGSVRWAQLLPALRELRLAEPDIRGQWHVLLDILDVQGDLGVTSVNENLIRAWAHFPDAREHLRDILVTIQQRSLDVIRSEIHRKYRGFGTAESLCGAYTRGKTKVLVRRSLYDIALGFAVPAFEREPAIRVLFWMEDATPKFSVEVSPWEGVRRMSSDPQLQRASRVLLRSGFRERGGYWWRDHVPDEYIDSEDVPARLLAFVEADVRDIVTSDILRGDLERRRRELEKRKAAPRRRKRASSS
jgi:hypothetical protein